MQGGSRRWNHFDLSGVLEIMPFTLDEVQLMGSDQQAMLGAMCQTNPLEEGGVLWLPHIHAIVHAPDIDWQEVRDLLSEAWAHPFQIKVEQFYDWQDKDVSIDKLARYPLKYEPGRMIGNGRVSWPVAWMAELYDWACSFSRSFQSFKFSIGPKKKPSAQDTLRSVVESLQGDGFSSFPIPLTDAGVGGPLRGTVVDLPLDHSAPSSAGMRWEMVDWCERNCRGAWERRWLTGSDLARFVFDDDVEAVTFKLTFSALLSGP